MTKTRLETFSDGVIAIIITIMVLELKIPHSSDLHAIEPLIPVFLSYILSFVFIGIYWGNHHHLLHTVHRVTSGIIWANLHLLFWLSLVPFTTAWMGENRFDPLPVAAYGLILLFCAISYTILQMSIQSGNEQPTEMAKALDKQKTKGYVSLVAYVLSIPLAFYSPLISALLFVFVSVIWIIPDRNIEKALKEISKNQSSPLQ